MEKLEILLKQESLTSGERVHVHGWGTLSVTKCQFLQCFEIHCTFSQNSTGYFCGIWGN
jgi:hypothetical protein